MSKPMKNSYTPDFVLPPGATLKEVLAERGMTQAELARRMGRPQKTISEIINGKAELTPETAQQLELVLCIPASFWNNLERNYREWEAREREADHLKTQVDWLKSVPVNKLKKMGWVQPYKEPVEQLRAVLQFFGVASPQQWNDVWGTTAVAYCKSFAVEQDTFAIAAWLCQGKIEAQEIQCARYDERTFRMALTKIRTLTVEPPEVFKPDLVRLCAEAGVAVVFLPCPPGTGISGAATWLGPHKALVMLSLRFKSDDHLWFTFFHEAGHILLHTKQETFVDIKSEERGQEEEMEEQANKFSADWLIPSAEWRRFVMSGQKSKIALRQFANSVEISPGIVVGRMQTEGHLPHSHCNDLKQRFVWVQDC
ncbi:MAG: helix-turn-helix domain-containing protein [Gemmatimonadaceae bacterium]|nr:helix-turn-helix domain-containing protein [Gloeobacterales cyanobacterium ES-bin-141]